ncbi:MAG: hypothetical protein H7067_09410 [Burkholderiales bacterium]|nr:hypothetical protein [Opitutaceae bacterium]
MLVVNRPGASARGGEAVGGVEGAGARNADGGAGVMKRSGPATGEGAAIATAFNLGDAEALRDELRAAGVDEELIRTVVSARIWKRYETRFKALQTSPDAAQAWWKNDEDGGYWGGQTKEQRAAMKDLQAEMKAESERVLGKDPREESMSPWLERQYGFVAAEKRQSLQELEQDYQELSSDLQRESRGFQMPLDADKARFLQEEKRRDLAMILTPEELADYDLRQSRTAQNLRWQMTKMDANEAEYRAVFEIRKEFDDVYNEYDGFGNRVRRSNDPEVRKERGEAEKAMKAQIKDALGAERYKVYVRANDHDYQQLQSAVKRFELPADTPAKIYDMRDEIPQLALRVADDANLTSEEKKAELGKLAEQARDRVKAALGPEVAQVYFDNNGMQWVRQLEQGTIISFDEDGGQQHRRIEQPPKKPADPKAK